MAIIKNEFPILEYSTNHDAIINPKPATYDFPRLCLLTFFAEVLEPFVKQYNGERIDTYRSEMKNFDAYKITYNNIDICVIQAVVASGSIAMMTDWLYGKGVEVLVCCGSCGVLDDIPTGDVIIPIRALRDEGASYKYLAPSRFVELDLDPIGSFEITLQTNNVSYIKCTTWSTDGFFRETKEMVEYRIAEGCKVVEMECATMAAIAKFRNKRFGQLLYSGDILVGNDKYDDRGWYNNLSAREKLFQLTLEALLRL